MNVRYDVGKSNRNDFIQKILVLAGRLPPEKLPPFPGEDPVGLVSPEERSESKAVQEHIRGRRLENLLLAGRFAEACELCNDEAFELKPHFEVIPACLNLPIDAPEVQAKIHESRLFAVEIYATYGLIELSKRNLDKAGEYFDNAIESRFFFYDYYHKSRALIKLLDNGYAFP